MQHTTNQKKIVISAINLRSGGGLEILRQFIHHANNNLSDTYKVIILVHKKSIMPKAENVEYIEFPKSVKSYLYRFYYEYFYFSKYSKKVKPYLWLSLHDMTPRVSADIRAVYCHNPSPFFKVSAKEIVLDLKFALFTIFYKYVYRINIKSNDWVIVQQKWIKEEFIRHFNLKNVIVAPPTVNVTRQMKHQKNYNKTIFFYPSFPRVFKNFEIICKAADILNEKYNNRFEVLITIDGKENKYSRMIFTKFGKIKNIKFIGFKCSDEVNELYANSDCLIFPSLLETYGLPLLEFKEYRKIILASDLPYAHATINGYDYVKYFNPRDPKMLAKLMLSVIDNSIKFHKTNLVNEQPIIENSCEYIFETLLKNKEKHYNDI